jgi:hemoglobin-like flavoprotein
MDALVESLELVASRVTDPAPLVYARLFAEHPEVEALFVRDRSGMIRGQMLQVTIETLLDLAGDGHYASGLLQTERVNHQGLGVPADAFDSFYRVLMSTFRDIAGADWTPSMEASWTRSIAAATSAALDV